MENERSCSGSHTTDPLHRHTRCCGNDRNSHPDSGYCLWRCSSNLERGRQGRNPKNLPSRGRLWLSSVGLRIHHLLPPSDKCSSAPGQSVRRTDHRDIQDSAMDRRGKAAVLVPRILSGGHSEQPATLVPTNDHHWDQRLACRTWMRCEIY